MIRHRHQCKGHSGATLLVAVLALSFLSALFGIAFATVQVFARLRESAEVQVEALMYAVNAMEVLKTEERPVSSFQKEGNLTVRWSVQEFTPTTLLLEVAVEDERGRQVLSLRTLRKKRISAS